jgi:sugar lactone lactonase YvrE
MVKRMWRIKLLAALLAALIRIGAHANPGDLYATDNTSVRVYAPDGSASIFASGLLRPRGLAFDSFGNLFVATLDTATRFDGRGQILKFAPNGTVTVFAVGLDFPEGIAFDGAGNLYVALSDLFVSDGRASGPAQGHLPGRVMEFSPSGGRKAVIFDPTTFHQNFGIAIDERNNLFVADNQQETIYKITPDRGISTFVSFSFPKLPIGLAFDGAGNLYASDTDPFDVEGNITRSLPMEHRLPSFRDWGAF